MRRDTETSTCEAIDELTPTVLGAIAGARDSDERGLTNGPCPGQCCDAQGDWLCPPPEEGGGCEGF
jgi:hypothetical protein